MSAVQIIDTFPAYLSFWSEVANREIDHQIEQWYSEYMVIWPELRQKQIDDYADQDIQWFQIAKEMVFPYLNDRLPAMKEAHAGLVESCSSLLDLAQERVEFDADILFVIYVGLGNGAGWVTPYAGKPAILYGLENIAECRYETQPTLSGLIAHELGHISHFHWRAENGLTNGAGPWWQLYAESFAQRCEHEILDQDLWHMKATRSDKNWLSWCKENKAFLAREYLHAIGEGKPVNSFFGSWYDIHNRKETGYYLGHEIIKELQKNIPFNQIALIDKPDFGMRLVLEQFAVGKE
jgi:hypothetical protein